MCAYAPSSLPEPICVCSGPMEEPGTLLQVLPVIGEIVSDTPDTVFGVVNHPFESAACMPSSNAGQKELAD